MVKQSPTRLRGTLREERGERDCWPFGSVRSPAVVRGGLRALSCPALLQTRMEMCGLPPVVRRKPGV